MEPVLSTLDHISGGLSKTCYSRVVFEREVKLGCIMNVCSNLSQLPLDTHRTVDSSVDIDKSMTENCNVWSYPPISNTTRTFRLRVTNFFPLFCLALMHQRNVKLVHEVSTTTGGCCMVTGVYDTAPRQADIQAPRMQS